MPARRHAPAFPLEAQTSPPGAFPKGEGCFRTPQPLPLVLLPWAAARGKRHLPARPSEHRGQSFGKARGKFFSRRTRRLRGEGGAKRVALEQMENNGGPV